LKSCSGIWPGRMRRGGALACGGWANPGPVSTGPVVRCRNLMSPVSPPSECVRAPPMNPPRPGSPSRRYRRLLALKTGYPHECQSGHAAAPDCNLFLNRQPGFSKMQPELHENPLITIIFTSEKAVFRTRQEWQGLDGRSQSGSGSASLK
jgi:hypothetical protein